MAFEVNNKVGPGYAADGQLANPRLTKDCGMVIQEMHGHFYEVTYRGATFIASIGVGGVAPGTVLSTTPPLTLYNPLNSGVNLSIISASDGYISGQLGNGTLVYAVNTNTAQAAPTGGTAITPICTLIGSGSLPKAKAYTGATVAAIPTILRDCNILGTVNNDANIFVPLRDIVDGSIVIMPGASLSLQAISTAGTSTTYYDIYCLGRNPANYREMPEALSWNDADDNNGFHEKLFIMDFDGTLSTELAMISDKQAFYHDMVTLGMPKYKDGTLIPNQVGVGGGFIPKGAKGVEVAKDLMKYWMQPQVMNAESEGWSGSMGAGHATSREGRSVVAQQRRALPGALRAGSVY